MIIILKFENTLDVFFATDFSFDNGYIIISNQDFTLWSEEEISKERFSSLALDLYRDGKLDLRYYSFTQERPCV